MKKAHMFGVVAVGLAMQGMAAAEAPKPMQAAPAAAKQAAPSAEQQAMMEKMKTLGAPSEGHKALEALVGSWTYTGTFWMSPDAPPEIMNGTAVNRLMFGGRFLQQEFRGPAMMENQPPFEGMGFTGYDNLRKEYQTIWFDNMNTSMMRGNGKFDTATKTLSDEGDFSCPITGETHRWYRSAWTITDVNHTTYRSFSRAPDGKEFKSMEMQYTRTQ